MGGGGRVERGRKGRERERLKPPPTDVRADRKMAAPTLFERFSVDFSLIHLRSNQPHFGERVSTRSNSKYMNLNCRSGKLAVGQKSGVSCLRVLIG